MLHLYSVDRTIMLKKVLQQSCQRILYFLYHSLIIIMSTGMYSFSVADAKDCPSSELLVVRALDTSPNLIDAAAEREAARAELLVQRSSRWPQVNVFGQTGIGNRQPLDQARDDQVGVSANLEITNFGQRAATIRAARETLKPLKQVSCKLSLI